MPSVLTTSLIAATALVASATAVQYPNCSGVSNPFPVNREPPRFERSVANGKRYLAGQGNDTFHIIHVYGTHYEMGYAHGQLMGEYFDDLWTIFIAYVEQMLQSNVPSWVPSWLIDVVTKYGLPAALQLTVDWTKPFTPQEYIDEMQGVADGAGYPFEKVYQLNMFPELIKAACTVVGATGQSTANGKIAHLRGLDIDAHMPIKDWPLVTVLHGNGTQPKVANFGWAMLVGSLTGISDHPIGIGEKVWLDQESTEGVKGQPWMLILRDVLYQTSQEAALKTMQDAHRTCAIHVGVGDGVENKFNGVTMDKGSFQVWNWSSINYPAHPIIEDVMYWDKHKQPDYHHFCLSDMLRGYYGQLSAEMLAVNVSSIGETGNMHSAAFDYEGMTAYFSNARKTNVTTGSLNAYARQYTELNVATLFSETKP